LPQEGQAYVSQGLLAASFEYPTGGTEAILTALDILNGKPVTKNITLASRVFEGKSASTKALPAGRSGHLGAYSESLRVVTGARGSARPCKFTEERLSDHRTPTGTSVRVRIHESSTGVTMNRLHGRLFKYWLVLFWFAVQASGQTVTGIHDLPYLKDFKAARSSSNNRDWGSNDDSKRPIPGETVVIADLQGPGQVNHIWLTIAANEYGWPRLLRLRVYYDGSLAPSVDAPVGDFFAVGHGLERAVDSLLVRDSSEGRSRNCYWPMPFRRSCKITVTNEGRRRVSNLYYHVDWQKMNRLPESIGYFHALYRQALPATAGKRLDLLSINGRGHYVGTVLSVIQNQPGWFGEGDEFLYVDGESYPSIQGTGSEDYFNDAWDCVRIQVRTLACL
jgi:hypothetical protein